MEEAAQTLHLTIDDVSDIGIYNTTIKICLVDYWQVACYEAPMGVVVEPCVVTDMPVEGSGTNQIKYRVFEDTGSKSTLISSVSQSPDCKYDIIYVANGMPSWVTFDPDTRIMTMPEQLSLANVGLYIFSIDAYVSNGDGNYFTKKISALVEVVEGVTEVEATSNLIEITDADEMIHRVHADLSMSPFEWQSK
jgi:hypothetical protein